MAFVLRLDRDPGAELARVMRFEVDSALRLLAVTPRDASAFRTAIHDARRALRRCRAVLRLLPPALAIDTLAQPLRAAGRALSALRDAQALLETLAQLQQQQPALLGSAHPALLQRLARQVRAGEHRHVADVLVARAALQALAVTLTDWQPRLDHAQLWRGLRRGSARAARAAHDARRERADDARVHRWRRRMREHALQLELLGAAWPQVLAGEVAERKRLARMLGHWRDLGVLQIHVRRLRCEHLGRLRRDSLMQRLRGAHAHLLQDAFTLGARVHAEPPRTLAARIARYHAAAQAGNAAHPQRGSS
ncbi:CHAD domain-containing protein [Metallibacterium scheffleri]